MYFHNSRGRRFVEMGYSVGLDFEDDGRAVLPVDVDGDGDLDLALLSQQGLKLLENTAPARAFARVRLESAGGDRHALGAIVRLEAGGVVQQDYVKATQGFATQVPFDLHFGLGHASRVDRVTVKWPGGKTETIANLPAGRLLTIRQGEWRAVESALPQWSAETRPRPERPFSLSLNADRLEGGRAPLSVERGPTIVNFWAPWCAPCREELPALAALKGRARIVGVCVEREKLDDVRAAVAQFQSDYPQFLAEPALLESFFGAQGHAPLPSTFVFDAEGKMRRAFHRPVTRGELSLILDSMGAGAFHVDRMVAGRAYAEHQEWDKAVAEFRAAIQAKPDYAEAWDRLGMALRVQGQTAESVKALRRAVELDPRRASAHANLGVTLRFQGQAGEAARAFRRAIELDPQQPNAHYLLGVLLYELRAHAEAETALREELKLDRGNAEAHHALGQLLADTGRLADGVASLQEAVRLKPSLAAAHNDLGRVLVAMGRHAEAVVAFQRALAVDPKLEEARRYLNALQRPK